MTQRPMLSIVVPVYNEEQNIPPFLVAVRSAMAGVTDDYEILFAADPGTDRTLDILREENLRDGRVKTLVFSRRFGQPSATWGGLACARGQAVVVIDCDLQDPPGLIPEMVRLWREGCRVVIPQRRSRQGENVLKRIIAYLGYKFINKIATVPIPRNTGDFRLLDRVVVDQLMKLNESHGFLRGLTALVGFKTVLLPFDRDARLAGQGKYNRITGSLRIGFNGIIAFSDYLLNLMVMAGFAVALMAVVAIGVVAAVKATGAYDFAAGLATVAILILFLTGVQFIGLGILGAYIGRIYDESKRRPKFIVEEWIGVSPLPEIENLSQNSVERAAVPVQVTGSGTGSESDENNHPSGR